MNAKYRSQGHNQLATATPPPNLAGDRLRTLATTEGKSGGNGHKQSLIAETAGIEIQQLIDFNRFACSAEGRSDKTIEHTTLALNKLDRFLESQGYPTLVSAVTVQVMREFMLHLIDQNKLEGHPYARTQQTKLSDQSINSYLRAIRAAWNRGLAEGLMASSPFQNIRIRPPAQKVINTFSVEQFKDLFGVIDISTAIGFRDYTLILLYLDTTCRLSELTGLPMKDLDLKERTAKVLGKGRRERIVPFGVRVAKLLYKYVNFYRPTPLFPNQDCVFLTRDGRPLTKNRVEAMLKKYGRQAGIEGVRVSPHTLRHTACLMWMRNKGDVYSLQKITGHASVVSLGIYVNLTQTDVQDAHKRYSPVDNLDARIKS